VIPASVTLASSISARSSAATSFPVSSVTAAASMYSTSAICRTSTSAISGASAALVIRRVFPTSLCRQSTSRISVSAVPTAPTGTTVPMAMTAARRS
jgi:hypothetical protein